MATLNTLRWQGSEQLYSLPWLKNRIAYTADPQKVADFARDPFTRSRLTRKLLTTFHLSNNSIVVSDDTHAAFLKQVFLKHLPTSDRFRQIAQDLVADLIAAAPGTAESNEAFHLSPALIKATYKNLLANILGARLLPPMADYIERTDFKPGMRPMHLEGLMYAFGLLLPGLAPARALVDLLMFKEERRTRHIARKLERLLCDFSTPQPGSWYSTLARLQASGQITSAQFRGELTSVLVSAYSLSAALSSTLICLAARDEYIIKVRQNRRMATCFVNEVLRLYPPFRQFGYERKGVWDERRATPGEATDFMVTVFSLHRDRESWTDPDRFWPERFLTPGTASGHKFLPFGMGKRACPGRLYSMMLLVEVVRYLCSEDCPVRLQLPPSYRGDGAGLPIGVAGRLLSFPTDDRLLFQRRGGVAHAAGRESNELADEPAPSAEAG